MRSYNSGFTLIELMITIAIVGILAAVSIPLFQGNVAKSQLARATSELAAYKAQFETGLTRADGLDNSALGYTGSDITLASAQIAFASPDNSGHLEVTMGGKVHPNLSGTVIRHVRSTDGRWSCVIDVSDTAGWKDIYLPAGCIIP